MPNCKRRVKILSCPRETLWKSRARRAEAHRPAGLRRSLVLLAVAFLGKVVGAFILEYLTWVLISLWVLFAVFTFYFFRDPDPLTPTGANLVIAPGHGKVDVIDTTTEPDFMGGECRRISIFLSVFDVHVQNAPVTGRIAFFKHTPGQYLNAMKTDSAQFNENVLIGFDAAEPRGEKIGVRLIAGLIARRIVPWVAQNDAVQRGERISLIQFGSRVERLSADARENQGQARRQGGRRRNGDCVVRLEMNEPIPKPPPDDPEAKLKIYFLPNLLTAGNLFCGFVALTKIVDADPFADNYFSQIKLALAFILLACIFDLFDGRVARMGGVESPFGREFDSLADLVSFGVAPAFLVQRVVLADVFGEYHQISWFIASIYLLCGAFRLARFNCLSAMPHSGGGKDFLGFPIPSAAGLVASLTLLIIHFNENGKEHSRPLELSDRGRARCFCRP